MARAVGQSDRRRRRMTPVEQDTAVSLYTAGRSGPQIATQLGFSVDAIYAGLVKAGVARGNTGSRNKRIGDADEQLLIELYTSGATQQALAVQFGISQANVSQILLRNGVETRRKPRIFSGGELAEIRQRYEALESAASIAESFGVGHTRIINELRRLGVNVRKYPARHQWVDAIGRVFTFRSLWELRVAQHLDLVGKRWDYEKETYLVLTETGAGTYTPDFWVYDSDGGLEAVIDIKGRWWPGNQQARVAAFVAQYPHLPFEVWDAAVLKTNSVRLV